MKKIYYLIAMAMMAFTFTSCEDVPEPFGQPINPNSGSSTTVDPAGSGTATDPYNVAAALDYVKGLGSDAESPIDVYISGIVTEVTEAFGTQYGNATFKIADVENGKSVFTFYRGLYLGNVKYSDASAVGVNVGDKVVICGKVIYYKGTTPETSQGKAYLVSINGTGGGTSGGGTGEAKGTGTEADPFNVAAAIAKCKEVGETASTEKYYIKGIADADYTVGSYKNIEVEIVDAEGSSDKFKVFRCKGANNKDFEEGFKVNKGDVIIVYGPVVNFKGNTPETATGAYIVSINGTATGDGGGGSVTPGTPAGTGTQTDPFNVAAAVAKCKEAGTTATTEVFYVKGIVNAEYTVDSYKNATFDMVDTEGASEKFKAYRVKGADGKDLKQGYKIPKGATVIVSGKLVNYSNNTPETAQNSGTLISVNGNAPEFDDGTSGGGSGTGGGGEAASELTNGNFETWANGLPTGWKSACTASSATLEQSTDAHGGSYSVLVKGGGTSGNKRLASQEIKLAAGSYNFSFWVKPTSGNKAQVRPGYVPVTDGSAGSYQYGEYATLNAGWQQVSYDFTLAAETTVCLVVMNPKANSYTSGEDVLVDDATLTKK